MLLLELAVVLEPVLVWLLVQVLVLVLVQVQVLVSMARLVLPQRHPQSPRTRQRA